MTLLALNKPFGTICQFSPHETRASLGDWVRVPGVYPAGRLDSDSEGLLLLTDDGALLHRIVSPKSKLAKTYEATLAQDVRGGEAALFASGTLLLESEKTPLAPAALEVVDRRHVRLVLTERFEQVRTLAQEHGFKVFAAVKRRTAR